MAPPNNAGHKEFEAFVLAEYSSDSGVHWENDGVPVIYQDGRCSFLEDEFFAFAYGLELPQPHESAQPVVRFGMTDREV